ncbi:MAG: hypothetical protein ACLTAS_12045 [Butyribacter sp.]
MTQKIYIGPTIPGVVTNGTIFKDKLPEHIEKKAEENKNIARLIIPIGDVLEAKKRDLILKAQWSMQHIRIL